jgi:hypothetical protein
MSSADSPKRSTPHRRNKTGYKSPSTIIHSKSRMKQFKLLINNFETLSEHYGMDTPEEQFAIQNYYIRFESMSENGESNWTKIMLNKKRIVWKNPANGFSVAALKEIDFEIPLPNALQTYQENYQNFKSLWLSLDYDVNNLFENIRSHVRTNEYCCLHCEFPFAPICSELYSQFEPNPRYLLPP